MKCKLSLIIEGIEKTNIDENYYLNKDNYRIWGSLETGDFYIDNYEIFDELIDGDNSISLPNNYEINKFGIIKSFINSLENEQIKNQLLIVIQGRGSLTRFKDTCINFGVIEEWYKFQNNRYYEIAKEWCIENNIDYEDDVMKKL